jgi:RNA polymerase sigma-70 factor (ECF subfamily)
MSPDARAPDPFDDALQASRRFLLTIANAELPAGLRAKGGASDLVQEALAAAHHARDQFHGRTLADLRAWLRAILLNELATFRRRYHDTAARDVGREVPLAAGRTGVVHALPLTEMIRREDDRRLAAAVARLPEDARLVVALRTEEGLSFAAIGARLGRSEEAARKLFARALDRLRAADPAAAG